MLHSAQALQTILDHVYFSKPKIIASSKAEGNVELDKIKILWY